MDPSVSLVAMATRNRDNLQLEVSNVLNEALMGIVEGAIEDIIKFTDQLSFDSIEAMTLPVERRDVVLKEIVAQVQALGEVNRLRAVNAGWHTVGRIVTVAQKTAVAMLVAAV